MLNIIMSKRKNDVTVISFIVLLLFLWTKVQTAMAIDYSGKISSLESVLNNAYMGPNARSKDQEITSKEKDNTQKTVFLYNVGEHKFLNAGDYWGTSPYMREIGIRCWLIKDDFHMYLTNTDGVETTYLIETACYNSVNNKYKWDKLGWDGSLVLDASTQSDSKVRKCYWKFTPVEGKENTYYIQQDYPTDANISNRYLQANGVSNVWVAATKPTNDELAQWQIVTEADWLDLFKKTTVDLGEDAVDVTFLLKDYNLDRYSREQGSWNWEPGTGTLSVGIDNHYQKYETSGSLEPNHAYHGGDAAGNDGPCGKYWCGKIINGSGKLSQSMALNNTGWYRISCKGEFYQKDAGMKNPFAFLFAKTGSNEVLEDLNPTSDPIEAFSETTAGTDTEGNDEGRRYLGDAKGQFDNTLLIYVDCGKDNATPATLTFGITVQDAKDGTVVPTSDLGVAFDSFRLEYLGTPAEHDLIIDEDFDNFDYITKEVAEHPEMEYKNLMLYLHRTFNTEKWNTIILPVNLTHTQFNTLFGAEAKLARYMGVKNDRLQFLVQDDKDKYDLKESGEDVYFKANTPYLIWPIQQPAQTALYSYTPNYTGATPVTIGNDDHKPYYVVNGVSLDVKNVSDNINKNYVAGVSHDGYSFCGTLLKNYSDNSVLNADFVHMKAGDYTFYDGNLRQFKKDYGQKGLRCWFTPAESSNSDNTTPAKVSAFEINGEGGSTTGVATIEIINEPVSNGYIYNIAGQKMDTKNLKELSRGIYIVNGKKYVVK